MGTILYASICKCDYSNKTLYFMKKFPAVKTLWSVLSVHLLNSVPYCNSENIIFRDEKGFADKLTLSRRGPYDGRTNIVT
jgi:hypothetical protein